MSDFVSVAFINVCKLKDDKFDIMSDDNAHLRSQMDIDIAGNVLAVSRDAVAPFMKDKDVMAVRMGWKKAPDTDVTCDDDFWRYMSYLVDLDEDF